MKYKLIHSQTKEEHLCDKVTIDGFDYYVSDDEAQIGEKVLWVRQTYSDAEKYSNYIGKVYTLKECFPNGKEIILKDFFPKKSLDEVRQIIINFLKKTGKERTPEQIEKNAVRNQATSGNLYLKIGYIISENDIKKVIATNNPNIDVPKVVDELIEVTEKEVDKIWVEIKNPHSFSYNSFQFAGIVCFKAGYNKSQETHPFSEDDICNFVEWMNLHYRALEYTISFKGVEGTKELLQLWQEQQPKIVYYE